MISSRSEGLRPFIDEADIRMRIDGLVKEIVHDLHGNDCIVVGVLKKSFIFLADFMRHLHSQGLSPLIDFITLSSEETHSLFDNKVTVERDITVDIMNKCVVLVDDVLDTGHTTAVVKDHLSEKGPHTLKTCVLLDKLKKREIDFHPDYVGFTIPDLFVVGYGLGYNHRCRELPSLSIAAFEEIDSPLGFTIQNNTVVLNGRLDEGGADYIRETLLRWKGPLRLDLGNLEYIDSTGVGLLTLVLKEIQKSGHDMALLNARPDVRRAIALGGLDTLIQR
jgi:hypoxanthine phosphoribosyltransferase